jgi:hypothetical protein
MLGTLEPRPLKPFTPDATSAAAVDGLPLGSALPKLVVFDLDHTIWTPELYTLRHLSGYARDAPGAEFGATHAHALRNNSERISTFMSAIKSRRT